MRLDDLKSIVLTDWKWNPFDGIRRTSIIFCKPRHPNEDWCLVGTNSGDFWDQDDEPRHLCRYTYEFK